MREIIAPLRPPGLLIAVAIVVSGIIGSSARPRLEGLTPKEGAITVGI